MALSTGPTHEDPLPPGVRSDSPTDTDSLYDRAGLDRRSLTRLTRPDRLRRSTTTHRTAAATPPGTSIAPGLTAHVAPSCTGDGTDGKRVQAMYVRDAQTPSRYQDVLPLLLNEIANVDDVFAVSAERTGGVRRVRWVHAGCVPVVPEVVVPAGSLGSFDATISALRDLGYRDPTASTSPSPMPRSCAGWARTTRTPGRSATPTTAAVRATRGWTRAAGPAAAPPSRRTS